MNIRNTIASRLTEGGVELVMRELRSCHDIVKQLSVVNEHLRPSLDETFQALAPKREHADQIVEDERVVAVTSPPRSELSPPFIEF